MRILIAGADSMAGRHMVNFLRAGCATDVLLGLNSVSGRVDEEVCPSEKPEQWRSFSWYEAESILALVEEFQPDCCYGFFSPGSMLCHSLGEEYLAQQEEQSPLPSSERLLACREAMFQRDRELLTADILGASHLLEALRKASPKCRVLLASSGAIYEGARGLAEDAPLAASTAFALAKLTIDLLGFQYFRAYHQPIVRVRPFELVGAQLEAEHWLSRVVQQIVRWEVALASASCLDDVEATASIRVPKLDCICDYLDVRDYVRGCWLALQEGTPGETYNLCSGVGQSLDQLEKYLRQEVMVDLQLAAEPVDFEAQPPSCLVGNRHKLEQATGWVPEHSVQDSIKALLQEQRSQAVLVCGGL